MLDAGAENNVEWSSAYTERFLSSLIALISIFRRPIFARNAQMNIKVERQSRDVKWS